MQNTKLIVPSSKYGIKCPHSMTPKGIVCHNTANDASAMAEISYMIGNNKHVSYHYAVDDYRVVQGIPDNRNAWHCGATYGNRNYLGVEICYSRSGGDRFVKAEQNAAKFIAMKMKEYGWGIDDLFTHQQMSGKYCPHRTLDLGWDRFKDMVRAELGQTVTPSKPTPPSTSGYNGSSIVEYLTSISVDSSFSNRRELANQYGISNYKGTASQNLDLLNKMKNSYKQEETSGYIVTITAQLLNVRSGPSIDYKIITTVRSGEAFTILDESNGWGKLKSGAGWINLSYTERT